MKKKQRIRSTYGQTESNRLKVIEAASVHGLNCTLVSVRDAKNQLPVNSPLRTLDAQHLAAYAAGNVGPLFTKDNRMQSAAKSLGIEHVN